MEHTTGPVLIIGHDLLALGLAAQLRSRGQRVVVWGGQHEDVAALAVPQRPAAIIVDLMVARRDDFSLLRHLQSGSGCAGIPILVLSPGTVVQDAVVLERRLRALDARPMLSPHDLDAVLGELANAHTSAA